MCAIVHLPVVEMRESASSQSRVVSQALFGEWIQVGDRWGDWAYVTTPDEYSGWMKAGSFVARDAPCLQNLETTRLRAHVYSVADTEYGPLMTLPYGSKLQGIDASDVRWHKIGLPDGREAFIQKGDVVFEPFDLPSFSQKFLGLPYTWGGRSSFGYDCSGFVQMLYGKLGVSLPRDARQQVRDPRSRSILLEELRLGDLIFWGKSEQEIQHVGMYLEEGQFIHTSARENKPYLRISQLSDFEWSGEKGAFYSFRTFRRLMR